MQEIQGAVRRSRNVNYVFPYREIALQIAMAYTKRAKFLSIEGGYHGNTIGARSVASSDYRQIPL